MDNAKQILHELLTICRQYTKVDDDLYTDNEKNLVKIVWAINDKLSIQIGKEYITTMLKENTSHMIIVYTCITSSTQKLFQELTNYEIELFNINELQFNITKHVLVPKHTKLSKHDTLEFTKRFGKKIPIMLVSDPIAKVYNYKKDDIIKIIRPRNEISYRICK
tara:strand:- start:142 stop:633 length:492 start_codon:yes stop_codon:yes gene_type:complete